MFDLEFVRAKIIFRKLPLRVALGATLCTQTAASASAKMIGRRVPSILRIGFKDSEDLYSQRRLATLDFVHGLRLAG
jgi:hypothetical protein